MTIKAHFDGSVIVPDEALDLQPNERLILHVERETAPAKRGLTAKDLLHSPLVGLWKDRNDVGDSAQFARRLRERAQNRIANR
jgi:hypothetical protein